MHQVITQGIGYLALFFVILSFQKSKRVHILLTMLTGVLLFVVHYSLLHAWTGALMNIIEASIVYVAYQKEKVAWAKSKIWLYFFIGAYILGALLTVKAPVDILPVIAQVAGAIAVWQTSPRAIRFIMLIPRPLWFTYNLAVGSRRCCSRGFHISLCTEWHCALRYTQEESCIAVAQSSTMAPPRSHRSMSSALL